MFLGIGCFRVKSGVFLTGLDFAKKKRISREKRDLGILGGLAGLFFNESKRGGYFVRFCGFTLVFVFP